MYYALINLQFQKKINELPANALSALRSLAQQHVISLDFIL